MDALQILATANYLQKQRDNYKSTWDDIGDYINLHRKPVVIAGQKKTTKVYSSRVMRSLAILVAGLHSLLTSPAVPWFTLKMRDKTLMRDDAVRAWLDEVTDLMYTAFSNSNYYNVQTEFYRDLGSYGIGGKYCYESLLPNLITFMSMSPYRFTFAENAVGEIDTVYRELEYTARQAVQFWPMPSLNTKIQQILKDSPQKADVDKFPFLHAIFPRKERSSSLMGSDNMPFASVYVDVEGRSIVEISGFEEFPCSITRWERPADEPYGLSPAIISLPDVKTVNARRRNMLIAEDKILNPPLDVPEGYKDAIRTGPGGLNYRESGADRIMPLNIAGRIDISAEQLQMDLNAIDEAFFVDVFRMFDQISRQMTAYEVGKREAEKMLMFGPVVGRLTHEALDKDIHRVFGLLLRAGYLPPPPEQIINQQYDIEYIGPLARAQKAAQLGALEEAFQRILPMIEYFPDIIDGVDSDEVRDYIFELSGVPERIKRTKQQIDELRQSRAEAQAQEEQQAQLAQAALTVKDLAAANKGQGLRQITDAVSELNA